MTEIKIQNGRWQKRLDKEYAYEKELKTYLCQNCTAMQNTEG